MIHAKAMHYALRRAVHFLPGARCNEKDCVRNFLRYWKFLEYHSRGEGCTSSSEKANACVRFSNCPPRSRWRRGLLSDTSGGKRNRPDADAKARTYIYIQHT